MIYYHIEKPSSILFKSNYMLKIKVKKKVKVKVKSSSKQLKCSWEIQDQQIGLKSNTHENQ
jgi:hypothetical protein